MQIRLQKLLASAGITSRRNAEKMIRNGEVSLNGNIVTQMGTTADPSVDTIQVNGRSVCFQPPPLTLMLNKPTGIICSADASQGRTVFSLLTDIGQRLFTIGRLDKNSEGLLLLTNDGHLANTLTHPRYEHQKIYEVGVGGRVTRTMLAKLNGPMVIDGKALQPVKVTIKQWRAADAVTVLEFVLKEGRNRQIRKMCEQTGLRIRQLRRTQMGSLKLGDLPLGQYRQLTPAELSQLGATSFTNAWN